MGNVALGGIRASVGGTSYTQAPAHSLVEFNAAYFSSEEFQQFQTDFRAEAVRRGVRIVAFDEAIGIWQERPELPVELEPSAAVELLGREENIVALAKEMGSRYKQYGMLVIVPDTHARQYVYTIREVSREEIGKVLAAMEALGISGGRYVDDRLEIADKDDRWREQVVALAQYVGKATEGARAQIILLEGDESDKAKDKAKDNDYRWSGPR